MAKEFWEVLSIEAWRPEGEPCYRFAVLVDGPAGTYRVDAAADDVLDYLRLQSLILSHLAVVWTHSAIEGRCPEARAIQWKLLLPVLLHYAQPALPASALLN